MVWVLLLDTAVLLVVDKFCSLAPCFVTLSIFSVQCGMYSGDCPNLHLPLPVLQEPLLGGGAAKLPG